MSDDLPVIHLTFSPIHEAITSDFGEWWREFLAPYQKLVDDGEARWPDPPKQRWVAVASVSWQDCADDRFPTVIPEAISRPVVEGDLVFLCEMDGDGDGNEYPMAAIGKVVRCREDRGLVDLERVSDIFRRDDLT